MFEEGKSVSPRRVGRWLLGGAVTAVVGSIATGAFAPQIAWVSERGAAAIDSIWCQGLAAMEEGDRLSEAATKDIAKAQDLFRQANIHYEKAYGCGFPDAGVRLVAAHCLGLGTDKNESKARQWLLQVEKDHPDRKTRIDFAKKACKL